MTSTLSTYDQYGDRIEIIGYSTTGLSGILFLTYFTMLFFSKSVQAQDGLDKLLILFFSLLLFTTGFFIPLHKNWARLLHRGLFLLLSSFSFFDFFDKGSWYFGLLFAYSLYGYWVLGHPMAVQFFRPLKPRETPLQKHSGWLMAHLSILTMLVLVFALKGMATLVNNSSQDAGGGGMGYLSLALLLSLILWGLRRLKSWARWLMIIYSAVFFLVLFPRSLTDHVQNYLEYWKALFMAGYYLSLCLFFSFARSVKTKFQPDTAGKPA